MRNRVVRRTGSRTIPGSITWYQGKSSDQLPGYPDVSSDACVDIKIFYQKNVCPGV